MNLFHRIKHGLGIFCHYYVKPDRPNWVISEKCGAGIPADLKKPQNVYLYDFARLGRRSTIMTMGDSKFNDETWLFDSRGSGGGNLQSSPQKSASF